MPTFILFIGLAIALTLTLTVIILLPWFQNPRLQRSDNQLLTLNISVFKQRLAELDDDMDNGRIDQATYDSDKLALERQLLDISDDQDTTSFTPNWKSRLIFLVWLPFLAGMAYLIIGDRTPVYKLWQAQDTLGQVADDLLTAKTDSVPEWASKDSVGLISAMQTNVHHNATDPLRWFRLSEVFVALEAPEQAIEALARAYRLSPDDEKVAITYAQTRFFTQGGIMDDETRKVVEHILKNNSKHQGAQMLMAMGEMRAGHFAGARHWVDLLKTEIQARPGDHTQALQSLTELEQTINEREKQSQNAITINVSITPEILGRVKKGDTLFVNVRSLAGGPPVAAKKLSADSLTNAGMSVQLDDNDSIMPTQTLSQAIASGQSLVVTARISSSGEAMPKSGDLTSNPVPLDNIQPSEQKPGQAPAAASAIKVLIDKTVP